MRHPQAKLFVEKMIEDYDAYMAGKSVRHSRRAPMPKAPPAKPSLADHLFTTNRLEALELARQGDKGAALAAMEKTMADRRVADGTRWQFLGQEFLPALVRAAPAVTVQEVIQIYRRLGQPDTARALGVNTARHLGSDINAIASAFASRGDFDSVVRLFDTYAIWDGDVTPIGYRANRTTHKIDFLRGIKRGEWSDAAARRAEAEKPAWLALLRKAAVEGENPRTRGNILLRLYDEERAGMKQAGRKAALDRVLMDEYMDCHVRQSAARRIPTVYTDGPVTNWYAIEDHLIRAVADGDWSYLPRSCYRRSARSDLLDVLCEIAACAQGGQLMSRARSSTAARRFSAIPQACRCGVRRQRRRHQGRVDKLDAEMERCGTAPLTGTGDLFPVRINQELKNSRTQEECAVSTNKLLIP